MKINHHNYEEYFILYMDNELGRDDRRMVEAFVQQHPNLKEELDLLLQYKLEPDPAVVFNGKDELIKINGETPVSLSNYEEWIVLYNDNELTPAQRTMVESFLITHPSLQLEFDQLKKARLEPETIVFAHKASLYRKEERTRPLPWLRIAAAAIFLLAIGITASLIISNKKGSSNNGDIVKEEVSPVIKKNEQDQITVPVIANKENITVDHEQEKITTPVTPAVSNKNVATNQHSNLKKNKVENVILPEQEEEVQQVIVVNKPTDLRASLNDRNDINAGSVNDAIAGHIASKPNLTKDIVTTPDGEPSNIDESKNKNRGLFRKIARTFEKRAGIDPTDDDRLLVAGLAIKLK
jgi:hypothetical protein